MKESWQTYALNVALSVTFKKTLSKVSSVNRLRTVMSWVDRCAGYVSIPEDSAQEPVDVDGAQCNVSWVLPEGQKKKKVILYLPGGAYVLRVPKMHRALLDKLARESDACGLMVEYRLAPEDPFPAGLNDSVAAYRWLLAQGIPAKQIAIAGDSAGGGLTMATLLALRDQGLPAPACATLLSPLLDLTDGSASRLRNASTDRALPQPGARAFNPRPLYIGDNDPKDPGLSPVYGNYTGLPPLHFMVSKDEMLLDDSLRAARRAQIFNVQTQVDIWPKVPHAWHIVGFLPETSQAMKKAGVFLKRHMDKDVRPAKKICPQPLSL